MADKDRTTATIDEILTRGIENVIPDTESLRKLLDEGKTLNVYFGIDPTTTRIHLGHAVLLRKIAQMSQLGHNVTLLIGDFTAQIGDTSDKEDERPSLSQDDVKQNLASYQEQASRFVNFDKVRLEYNSSWLSKLTFGDILSLTHHFSLNDFLSRELIKARLESGKRVSLSETLYPLMQGYDSYHLDTDVQFGATDQTFNMQAGRTLQKRLRDKESYVVASGYLPGTDGRKMSKSWGNAIWLDDTPEDIYGKVMSLSDEIINTYAVMATNLSIDEVTVMKQEMSSGQLHPMEAKQQLARQIVTQLHSQEEALRAEKHFRSTVQDKQASSDTPSVNADGLVTAKDLIELLVNHQLVASASQARRLFDQGAIRLNDNPLGIDDDLQFHRGNNQLRIGKRRYLNVQK